MSRIERNKKDIVYLMEKYNKTKIEIVDKINISLVSSDIAVCSSGDNIYYSILKDDILTIKGTLIKDNIHLYYEFMSDEDIYKYRNILKDIFIERFNNIAKSLNLYNPKITKYDSSSHYDLILFGTKDTLRPIDEYIAEIKESSEYKEYKKSIFLKNGKSEAASNVLKLLDKDYDYKIAFEDTLGLFDVTKEDLELELDIYI